MLISAKSISGLDLPLECRVHEQDATCYTPIKVGEPYLVLGLMLLRTRMDALISPEESAPMWFPLPLCEILDNTLPPDWKICMASESDGYKELSEYFLVQALIGYADLVSDYKHYEGILERDSGELAKFQMAELATEQWWASICT